MASDCNKRQQLFKLSLLGKSGSFVLKVLAPSERITPPMKDYRHSISRELTRTIICLCWLAASTAHSQTPNAPQPASRVITVETGVRAAAAADADVISMMCKTAYDSLFSYLAKPETAAKLAKFQRNYYTALLHEGFSKTRHSRL